MQHEPGKAGVLKRQMEWALRRGKCVDALGYLDTAQANLYQPMSAVTLGHFQAGSGAELLDTPARAAKIRALHSSAALAVNVFDYWTARDAAPLALALSVLPPRQLGSIRAIGFERQYPTGLAGNPPNLDVTLTLASGVTIAVESKFTEWMTPRPTRSDAFRPAYFPDTGPLWGSRGLHRCQHLAAAIAAGEEQFRWLDAPQLLKHALGLATVIPGQFSLQYLYFDSDGQDGAAHRAELVRFSSLVGDETGFVSQSYQEFFGRICSHAAEDDWEYLAYLRDRYF